MGLPLPSPPGEIVSGISTRRNKSSSLIICSRYHGYYTQLVWQKTTSKYKCPPPGTCAMPLLYLLYLAIITSVKKATKFFINNY